MSNTEFYGGELKESKISAKLSRDEWNNLYKNGKVSLFEIPRKYQAWINGENSKVHNKASQKYNNTQFSLQDTLNSIKNIFKDSKDGLKTIAEVGLDNTPIIGDIKGLTYDPYISYKEGGMKDAMKTAGIGLITLLPFTDALKTFKVTRNLNKALNTPQASYRISEHTRSKQLQDFMDYGSNSNILVHGDPVATGVKRVKTAIRYTNGKIESFPHFKNGSLVPGENSKAIFWGDGKPFFETRTKIPENILYDDNNIRKHLIDRNKIATEEPNEFILDNSYRYVATNKNNAKNPVVTRLGVTRDATEIQTKEAPVDKIWGIEWNPLVQTWEKHIYSPKAVFKKRGGRVPLNKTLDTN